MPTARSRFANSSFSQVFNYLEIDIFSPHELSAFFSSFCTYPLVFYAYYYFSLFVRKMVHGPLVERDRVRKIALETKASQLLNAHLSHLSDEDIEHVLLAMTLMLKQSDSRDNDDEASINTGFLFTPHPPYADIYRALKVGHVSSFVPAVKSLVDRRGGLDCLRNPGLARIIRR